MDDQKNTLRAYLPLKLEIFVQKNFYSNNFPLKTSANYFSNNLYYY